MATLYQSWSMFEILHVHEHWSRSVVWEGGSLAFTARTPWMAVWNAAVCASESQCKAGERCYGEVEVGLVLDQRAGFSFQLHHGLVMKMSH